jgi:hypothetical protein
MNTYKTHLQVKFNPWLRTMHGACGEFSSNYRWFTLDKNSVKCQKCIKLMSNLSKEAQQANDMKSQELSWPVKIGGRRFKFLREEQELLSRTWKERHAKGVPVNMTFEDMEEQCHDAENAMYGLTASGVEEAFKVGKPYVIMVDNYTDVASIRNFRYKQSWLEKK